MPKMRRLGVRPALSLAMALVVASLAGGCGENDDPGGGNLPIVNVRTAADGRIEMPSTVEGEAIKFVFVGSRISQETFTLFKLKPKASMKSIERADRLAVGKGNPAVPFFKQFTQRLTSGDSPTANGYGVGPGRKLGVVLTLKPGSYFMYSPAADRRRPGSRDALHKFDVRGSSGADPVELAGKITAYEDRFEVSRLKSGKTVVALTNESSPFDGNFFIQRVDPGSQATAQDIEKLSRENPKELERQLRDEPNPFAPLATVSGLFEGYSTVLELDLTPDKYEVSDEETPAKTFTVQP